MPSTRPNCTQLYKIVQKIIFFSVTDLIGDKINNTCPRQ